MWGEGLLCNPSVLTAKSLINQKGGCIASKTQQSDSLRLAVNPPPFNKGGKCGGAKQGIVRFWKVMRGEGLLCNPSGSRPNFFGRQHLTFNKGGKFSTGRGDGCTFEKVVEMERAVQREGQARQGCLK